jgi:hypothetical protein
MDHSSSSSSSYSYYDNPHTTTHVGVSPDEVWGGPDAKR